VFTTSDLVPNLLVSITGRLGSKTLVVNTKWRWHLSILPWLPESPFTVHTCMCAESCPKKCFYKPFNGSLHTLTGRLGTKSLVTTQNGRGIYQSFLGFPNHRYCSCMYVCRELSKRVLLQTFQEESTCGVSKILVAGDW